MFTIDSLLLYTRHSFPRLIYWISLVSMLVSLVSCERPNSAQLDSATPAAAAVPASPTTTPAPSQTPQATFVLPSALPPTSTATSEPEPTADSTAVYLSCLRKPGRVEQSSFPSVVITDTVRFRIYLPGCYAALPVQRFPALYLLHGQGFGDDQWERLGVPQKMDALQRAGRIPPFLVVMPYDPSQKEAYEDDFGSTFPLEVVPWIDNHYRTLVDRQHRAIGGLSRGSGWAAHFGLLDWEKFGAIGLHSISIFWSDVSAIKSWLSDIPPDQMPAIYIDIGDREKPKMLESARWFEELLTDQGIAHEWHLYRGYHDENYWQLHVEFYLLWYADQLGR